MKDLLAIRFLTLIIFCLNISILEAQNYDPCITNTSFHVVVLGSSTAAGSGPSSQDSAWVNRYRKHLQSINPSNRVTNLASGGKTTYHIMPDWFSDTTRPTRLVANNISQAIRLGADAVIVNMPSNDASNGFGPTEQLRNFRIIKSVADSNNVKLWLCTTQPKNFGNQTQKQIQLDVKDSILANYGVFAIDFWNGFADSTNGLKGLYDSGDGTHMNDLAHGELNRRVINKLIPNYLTDTLAYTDLTVNVFASNSICGDSSDQVEVEVINLGSTFFTSVFLKIESIDNNSGLINSTSFIIPGNFQSCSSIKILHSINTTNGADLNIRAYLDSVDVNTANDTASYISIIRKAKPQILASSVFYCKYDSVKLQASTSNNNTVVWYDSLNSTTPLFFGKGYSFKPSSNLVNNYVEAVSGPLHFKTELFANRTTNVNWNGYMFDLVATDTIHLDSISLKLNTLGDQKVVGYFRVGSHKGVENNAAKWTYWGLDSAQVNNSEDLQNLKFSPQTIFPNDTLGIYLHLQNASSRLSYQSSGNSNSTGSQNLFLLAGTGVSHTFGTTYFPRNFSGKLHYHYGFNPRGECQSERIKVSATANPKQLSLGNDTTIDHNSSLTLNQQGFTNYSWNNGDTTSQIIVDKTNFGIGSHTIILNAIDSIGCAHLDTIVVAIDLPLSINENNSTILTISPNPTDGFIYINGLNQNQVEITIIDVSGKRILKQNLKENFVDLTSLSKGIYFISVVGNQINYTEKLIIK